MYNGIKIAVVIYSAHVYNMILVSGHNAYYNMILVSGHNAYYVHVVVCMTAIILLWCMFLVVFLLSMHVHT